MSIASSNMHFDMGVHSPYNDNVEQAECSEIDSCKRVSGGYICVDCSETFIVSDDDYQKLYDEIGRYSSEPAKLIGLAIHRGLYHP